MSDIVQILKGGRNRLWAVVILLTTALSVSAQEDQLQVQFGVRGGLQLTQMDFNKDVLATNNRAGFSVGPVLKFKTPVAGFMVDAGLLYDQRDLKVDGQVMKQKSVLLPANARLGANVFNMVGIFLCAGPQFSFNLGDDMLQWIDEQGELRQFTLQNTTLSLNIGGGVTFGKHLEGAVYYNVPLGKTGDFTWNDMTQTLQGESWNRAKSKVDAWRLCVTYYF